MFLLRRRVVDCRNDIDNLSADLKLTHNRLSFQHIDKCLVRHANIGKHAHLLFPLRLLPQQLHSSCHIAAILHEHEREREIESKNLDTILSTIWQLTNLAVTSLR